MTPIGDEGTIGEVGPEDAWRGLSEGGRSLLIDVRTRAEWSFVGLPDLSAIGAKPVLIEWQRFPDMSVDQGFAEAALEAASAAGAETVYFLCRSGGRSMRAALATAEAAAAAGRKLACVNVAEGFEGDLDAEGRRGRTNGWKARGLPWRQS